MAAPTITHTLILSNDKDLLQQNNSSNNNPNNNQISNAAFITSSFSSSSSSSSSSTSSISALSSAPLNNSLRLRKRHRKRHSYWDVYNNFNENSTILEWSNPCGGEYDPRIKNTRRPNNKEKKRIYKFLGSTALNDFNSLNNSHRQDINISNIEIWWLHNYQYKFLPKLKANSSIALKRWYRNMQTYVASFAYLRRIQYTWDHSKSQHQSNTTAELKELFESSRKMLCELEAAVNKTNPYRSPQMPLINRAQMNKRLKLRTKQRAHRNPHELTEADSIDLKFVKYHFLEYLKKMSVILGKFNKRRGQVGLRNNRQQENPKEFNEIEKNGTERRGGAKSSSRSRARARYLKSKNKLV
uniref:Uncharacterized protein n=1 Tax=Stomoxys calcitrans TaxID=35570 RepID=A0A1I8QEV4_STOCA